MRSRFLTDVANGCRAHTSVKQPLIRRVPHAQDGHRPPEGQGFQTPLVAVPTLRAYCMHFTPYALLPDRIICNKLRCT
jgi:hypothetical protein